MMTVEEWMWLILVVKKDWFQVIFRKDKKVEAELGIKLKNSWADTF